MLREPRTFTTPGCTALHDEAALAIAADHPPRLAVEGEEATDDVEERLHVKGVGVLLALVGDEAGHLPKPVGELLIVLLEDGQPLRAGAGARAR